MKHYTPIKTILSRATAELIRCGSDSARLDTKVLFEAAAQQDPTFLFSHPEAPMTNAAYQRFRRMIRRRKTGEPVAYILGHKEFYGNNFIVNKNVLVPRPETELLVDEALKIINNCTQSPKAKFAKSEHKEIEPCKNLKSRIKVLDTGTGSGNIIISLAKELENKPLNSLTNPQADLYATDISTKTLGVAKKNAALHGVKGQIRFYCSDLLANQLLPKRFDLIIANLPYVPKEVKTQKSGSEMKDGVDFEPDQAVFAEDNGTAIIKKFLNGAKDRLSPNGAILLELDPRNASDLEQYARKSFPTANIKLSKDLAGLDRILTISRSPV